MADFADIAARLEARLAELAVRTRRIEDDLRSPLDDDSEERASERADDEALEGVDDVLHAEANAVRAALARIAAGTYGTCVNCGAEIPRGRLEARPVATTCIRCAA